MLDNIWHCEDDENSLQGVGFSVNKNIKNLVIQRIPVTNKVIAIKKWKENHST